MVPSWKTKTDPAQNPTRFLAGVWQQLIKKRIGIEQPCDGKTFGQFRNFRKALGDQALDVIEWMLDPVNWWQVCQQVRSESGSRRAPDYPHIGYLLTHKEIALKNMRCRLKTECPESDVLRKLERKQYEGFKTFLLEFYGKSVPEKLKRIEQAKTLTEIQRIFIEVMEQV
jgi:hypothetical protein